MAECSRKTVFSRLAGFRRNRFPFAAGRSAVVPLIAVRVLGLNCKYRLGPLVHSTADRLLQDNRFGSERQGRNVSIYGAVCIVQLAAILIAVVTRRRGKAVCRRFACGGRDHCPRSVLGGTVIPLIGVYARCDDREGRRIAFLHLYAVRLVRDIAACIGNLDRLRLFLKGRVFKDCSVGPDAGL